MEHGSGHIAPAQVGDCLAAGGVALIPTDTVYGLAVHPTRDDAIARLFAMKRRPATRNLPIMVAAAADLKALGVVITDPARRLLDAFAPGPLSIALGLRADGSAPGWLAGRVEVAVRIPADPVVRSILEYAGPLLVTSANLHECPTEETVSSILSTLDGRPEVVIDGGPRQTVPSTLVNCNLPVPVVERAGVIPESEIWRVLR